MGELDGRAFRSYEIIRELGHGGMAVVYLGRQTTMDRLVAIKVIAAMYSTEADFRARFDQEARTIARLEHPHILPVIDYGEEDFGAFLVMRYVDGGTLEARLKAGPLLFDEAYDMLGKVASALDYAHSRGVVHRDLKPANILLDSVDNPYLTDFGIAKILQNTTQLTRTGAAVGTPAYMAPEQWKSEPVGPYTDQYALGVVLYEMVTGDLPFKADTTFGYMHKHIYEQPEPPNLLLSDLPEAAGDVILRALAKDPEGRFLSLRALFEAFGQALYEDSTAPTRPANGEDATALNATVVDPAAPVQTPSAAPATVRRPRTPTPRPPVDLDADADETSALSPSAEHLDPAARPSGGRGWLVIAAVAVITVLVLILLVAGGAGLLGGGPTATPTATEPIMVAAAPTDTAAPIPQVTSTEASSSDAPPPPSAILASPARAATGTPTRTEPPTDTPTPSPTPSPTLSATPSRTPTPSETVTPSDTPAPTDTATLDVAATQEAALIATSQQVARDLTATSSALIFDLATSQAARTGTAIAIASFTATVTPSPTRTPTLTPSNTPTLTPSPTRTPILPTITPRPFASSTPRPSLTPVATATPTPASCPSLLPSRIMPGMRAVVSANDPRPVNVRNAPGLTATRIGQFPVATQFMVLEGPTCRDGYAWFRVQRSGGTGLTGWIAESGEGVYYVDPLDGTRAASQACPGVMAPRLTIGGAAVVDTPTNEPLRLRDAPGEAGRVIGLVPVGARLTVLDGLRCVDGMSWWEFRLLDGRTGWASEADADSYFVAPG